MAAAAGKRIVEMVWEDLTPDRILTRKSFENALTVQAEVHGHGALGSGPEASVGVDGSHLGSPVAEVDGKDPGHLRPRVPWSA